MSDLNELNDLVIEWARDRGILEKATPAAQYQKTVEEVGELGRYLMDYVCSFMVAKEMPYGSRVKNETLEEAKKAEEEVRDAIGDIVVTLIIQCELNGLRMQDCLQQAYDVISKRKGKMVDGIFVKDED